TPRLVAWVAVRLVRASSTSTLGFSGPLPPPCEAASFCGKAKWAATARTTAPSAAHRTGASHDITFIGVASLASLPELRLRVRPPRRGGAHLADSPRLHLVLQLGQHGVDRHGAEVAVDPVAHCHGARRLLLVPHHQHVGDLLQLRLADLEIHLLRP